MSITILNQGTRVKTLIGSIEALITGVCIRNGNAMYELSYFTNGDHKTTWLYRFEIDVMPEKREAGFNFKPEKFEQAQID